jgi:hypothetical protein
MNNGMRKLELMRRRSINKKYAKINKSKGLTPTGKRRKHFYNTILK